ncbi:MAG: cupin domain-containing protein [Candidatus Latescibacteria bacterium]|nr:cupin domain-containing protein [Candidatus Latescibacterota bacterium]
MQAEDIITLLGLKPLYIEGGYFRETYRSDEKLDARCLPPRYSGGRELSTAIYYLVTVDSFSALHRLVSDEVFHFYLGDPVALLWLFPDGCGETVILGNDLASGHVPQCTVRRNTWQGLRLVAGGRWALLGTTVTPAFLPGDFELGDRNELIARYPDFTREIEFLTAPRGR